MQKSVGSPSWLREGSAAAENVNLWLRWPEAGMLRTASHSESEAAERTVRPWILWTLLRRLSKARRGTVFYSLSPPPFSLPLRTSPLCLLCPPRHLFTHVSNFSTLILCIPMLWPESHHSPSNLKSCSFLVDLHLLSRSSLVSTPGRLRPGLPFTCPHLGHRGEQ